MRDSIYLTIADDGKILVQVFSVECRCFTVAGWGIVFSWLDARYNHLPIHINVMR